MTLLVLCIVGCATPLGLVQRGRLVEGYDRAQLSDAATKQEVVRAIIAAENPAVEVRAIEGEELARIVGPYTARQLTPTWLLVRATLSSRAREFRYLQFNIAVGRDGDHAAGRLAREAPSFSMKPAALVALTGERMPEGYTTSDYDSSLCDNAFLCLLFMPLVPATSKKVGEHYVPPTIEQIRLRAPRAAQLAALLNDQCDEPGRCVRHLLIRRPLNEAEPLSLRATILLASYLSYPGRPFSEFTAQLGAIATLELPPGSTLATRLAVTVAPASMSSGVHHNSIEIGEHRELNDSSHFCEVSGPAELDEGGGPCSIELVPLSAPPLPPPTITPPAHLSAAAAASLPAAWSAAVNAVELAEDRLQVFQIDAAAKDNELGLDQSSLEQARAAVAALAPILGAGDPRVRNFEERLDRLESSALGKRAKAVSQFETREASCRNMELPFTWVTVKPGRCAAAAQPTARLCTYAVTVRSFSQWGTAFRPTDIRVLLSDGRIVQPELVPKNLVVPPQQEEVSGLMQVTIPSARTASPTPPVPQTLVFPKWPLRSLFCALGKPQ